MYDTPINYGEDPQNKMSVLGSFYPFVSHGNLVILVNEKESILKDKKIVMGYHNINAKAIVLRSFDSEGNIKTLPMWNRETGSAKDYSTFAPTQTLKITDHTYYISASGEKMHKFGKLTLKY